MAPQARLRARISILVALGALFVAAGVALLLINTVGLRNSADSAISADAYLLRASDVERLVVDVETGLRGYLLTGHTLFLEPLRAAQAQMPAATSALRRAAAENTTDRAAPDALIARVDAYMTDYVQPLLARASRDLPAAGSFPLTLEGKRQVDAIRAQTAALERRVSARQTTRQRAARRSADQSIVEAVAALVLLTLLTAILGAVLGHVAVGRERARQRSETTSQTLQESLIPSRLPTVPDCELAARFVPAAGLVGGDFYDAFETVPGSWTIVGDVCGKGTAAAAVTAMARWRLRTALESGASAGDALRSLTTRCSASGSESASSPRRASRSRSSRTSPTSRSSVPATPRRSSCPRTGSPRR